MTKQKDLVIVPFKAHRSKLFENGPYTPVQAEQHMTPPVEEQWLAYLFKVALPQTDFSGRTSPLFLDLQSLLRTSPALVNACVAFSAMYSNKSKTTEGQAGSKLVLAHEYYEDAVKDVKKFVEQPEGEDRLTTLWAVLLLSLFEVGTPLTSNHLVESYRLTKP